MRSGSQNFLNKFGGGATTLSEANLAEMNGQSRIMSKARSYVTKSSQSGRPISAATYTTQMASHMS